MKAHFTALVALSVFSASASAKTITIEKLTGSIGPKQAALIEGLFCRNVDKIVHVNISVDWPQNKMSNETERVTFWTDQAEFLFPKKKVTYLHGAFIVNGYFITRAGGTHQGVTSMAFEAVDDASVMLNPSIREVPAKRSRC